MIEDADYKHHFIMTTCIRYEINYESLYYVYRQSFSVSVCKRVWENENFPPGFLKVIFSFF